MLALVCYRCTIDAGPWIRMGCATLYKNKLLGFIHSSVRSFAYMHDCVSSCLVWSSVLNLWICFTNINNLLEYCRLYPTPILRAPFLKWSPGNFALQSLYLELSTWSSLRDDCCIPRSAQPTTVRSVRPALFSGYAKPFKLCFPFGLDTQIFGATYLDRGFDGTLLASLASKESILRHKLS